MEASAPDIRVAELMRQQRDQIEEALRTVGEYVLNDGSGKIYVITAEPASAKKQSGQPAAAGA